jgi:hypothetical protein
MNIYEVQPRLEITGLPVTYRAWPEKKAPPLPFICWLVDDYDNLFADGEVYTSVANVRVELYARKKDPSLEAQVEQALAGLHWTKTETYIASERCYMILYEIEVFA